MSEITVIIPSYNMPEGTVTAIESVLIQELSALIIVVDDHSQLPLTLSKRIMDTGRVEIIRQEKNLGAAAARNRGVKASTTDWVTFLDADDVLLPKTLGVRLTYAKEAVRCMANNLQKPVEEIEANAMICCGWIEPDDRFEKQRTRIPNPASTAEEFAAGCWYSPGSTALINRSVFQRQNREYNENLKRLEDFDWGIRFGKTDGKLLIHPIAGASIRPSNRTNSAAVCEASRQILKIHRPDKDVGKKLYSPINAYLALEQMTAFIRENKWLSAGWAACRSFYWKPRIKRHLSPGWTFKVYQDPE